MPDDLDEYAGAVTDLARMIRKRIPTWTEERPEPGLWIWTDPDEETDTVVMLDGSRRRFMPSVPWRRGIDHGPTLIGYDREITVRVDLPHVVDRSDLGLAQDALVAIGALPAS